MKTEERRLLYEEGREIKNCQNNEASKKGILDIGDKLL
jgi:hypothetical protein